MVTKLSRTAQNQPTSVVRSQSQDTDLNIEGTKNTGYDEVKNDDAQTENKTDNNRRSNFDHLFVNHPTNINSRNIEHKIDEDIIVQAKHSDEDKIIDPIIERENRIIANVIADGIELTQPISTKGRELIGQGNHAGVYKAGENLVLKVLCPKPGDTPYIHYNEIKDVEAGIHIIKQLGSNNLAEYHILDETIIYKEPHILQYTSRRMIGDALHISPEEKLSNPRIADHFIIHLGIAIEYLTSHNIIYCNLKPENVLYDKDFIFYLSDFGGVGQALQNPVDEYDKYGEVTKKNFIGAYRSSNDSTNPYLHDQASNTITANEYPSEFVKWRNYSSFFHVIHRFTYWFTFNDVEKLTTANLPVLLDRLGINNEDDRSLIQRICFKNIIKSLKTISFDRIGEILNNLGENFIEQPVQSDEEKK